MKAIWISIGATLVAIAVSLAERVSSCVSEDACRYAAAIVVGEVTRVDSRAGDAPGVQGAARVELSVSDVLTGPVITSATIVVATTDGRANVSSVERCLNVGYKGTFFLIPTSPGRMDRMYWRFVRAKNEVLSSALLDPSHMTRDRVAEVIRTQALDGSVFIAGEVNILGAYRRVPYSDGMLLDDLLQDSGGLMDFVWRVFVVGGQTGKTVSYDVFRINNPGRLGVKNSPITRGSVVFAVRTAHRL